MGVDSSTVLAPSPVVVEQKKPVSVEHKPNPNTTVTEIFDRSDNESPHETLTELAKINPNQPETVDTSPETPEGPTVTDSQPETPSVDTAALQQEDAQQTAEDIEQVTETIQQESTSPKTEEIIPIPNVPNLREIKRQQDQQKELEQQKHPLKNRLEKIKSKSEEKKAIDQLKKKGVQDAENYYKKLSEIGVSKSQIIANTPKFVELNMAPEQITTAIERTSQLNYLNSGKFFPDIYNAIPIAAEINELSNNDFNQRLLEAQKYPFLNIVEVGDTSSIISFLRTGFDQSEKTFLDQIKELINSSDKEKSENAFDIPYDTLFTLKTEGKLEERLQLAQKINDRITIFFDTKQSGSVLKEQQARLMKFCLSNNEDKHLFFEVRNIIDGSYNQDFIKHIITTNEPLISDYFLKYFRDANVVPLPDKIIQTFTPEEQRLWKGISKIDNPPNRLISFLDFNKANISQYFDENYRPTENLINDMIAANVNFDSFKKLITQDNLESFSPDGKKTWQTVLELTSQTENQSIKDYIYQNRESISKRIYSQPNPQEIIKQYSSILEQINLSPSKEIQKIKNQLLVEILNNSNPLESYQKISDIFIKNNLPMVGKIYRVFEVLYSSERVNQMLSNSNKLSRVLIDTKSSRLRQQIIFNDLLKANLGSGEQSLVNYLNLFQTSSPLLEKARVGESLTSNESLQLSSFFKKLDTLYDVSLLSRLQPTETLDTPTLQSKVTELYQKYKVAEGQTISDRVAQMYLSGLGIKSIPEALTYIKQIRESAHQRNLSRTDFSVGHGDLIKGIEAESIDNILNFGCVAREYLGSDAGSDSTPFDTDFIRSDSILNSKDISTGFGHLFIVVKDRGQLQNTTDIENPNYDPNKLEVFYSGVVDKKHYGVRTGFPSSEIDFFVAADTSSEALDRMYYEIAKHGVYIPVLDREGNQIFTPQDYFHYRHSFDGVKQFDGDPIQIEISSNNDPFRDQIDDLKKSLETESSDEVAQADNQIREKIKSILDSLDIKLKDQFDTSLLGARLYNIGSSGRHTNLPGDFDFDYNLILDVPNYSKSQQLINEINRQLPHLGQIDGEAKQIRLTGVTGIGPESIDLDIGINTTADTLIFASHEAIEQKLDSIKQTYGQDTYNEVVANILLTKQILKQNHAYKKGDGQDGGFGGIGVENWILSNNGSIKKAFESFWEAAHNNGQEVPLNEFRTKYFILDSGQNLRDTNRHHDNFIFTLTDKGYNAMLQAIGKYIS